MTRSTLPCFESQAFFCDWDLFVNLKIYEKQWFHIKRRWYMNEDVGVRPGSQKKVTFSIGAIFRCLFEISDNCIIWYLERYMVKIELEGNEPEFYVKVNLEHCWFFISKSILFNFAWICSNIQVWSSFLVL